MVWIGANAVKRRGDRFLAAQTRGCGLADREPAFTIALVGNVETR
jgi:hypothetical protein